MQGGRWAAFSVFMPGNSGGAPWAGGKDALAGMTWDVNEAEDLKTRRQMKEMLWPPVNRQSVNDDDRRPRRGREFHLDDGQEGQAS